ncbi:TlpA disulfide reductase family protein [Dysgonomonas sp. 511]|uniref:TlpA family protein disulfide reductase n=1 Tax=Dysgonomonas sp. 511 TaxID=2302930 RepID=UPI0013D4298F|nr:TlpA disulfide reductase family protein [Dysgonomonas sp. 511]NDV78437.1 TlpA family protein disulfide reductase [Dysgonomonas sp. 511]
MKHLFITIGFLMLSITVAAQNENGDIIVENDNMPAFRLSSSVYGNIDSEDLKGKVILINIFTTWCRPCQVKLAEVEKSLYPKFKDNPDFIMLSVGREHTDEELAKYNKTKNFPFPLYPDPNRAFTGKFATQSIPRSYLIDKNGKVIMTTTGYTKAEHKQLIKSIEKSLK